MTLTALSSTAHAQYLFRYAVWGDYTHAGDGSPFANQLCAGLTSAIFYDSDALTNTPKFTDICPQTGGANFGMQFAATLYAAVSGSFNFYVGSDDGSGLYIDGTPVLALAGEQPFTSGIVTVPFLAGTTHTYLLNYYANTFGGSAVQATVDPRLDVMAGPVDAFTSTPVTATPEPATLVLVASAFGGFAVRGTVRRRRARASA
jgi:hypothetical protein